MRVKVVGYRRNHRGLPKAALAEACRGEALLAARQRSARLFSSGPIAAPAQATANSVSGFQAPHLSLQDWLAIVTTRLTAAATITVLKKKENTECTMVMRRMRVSVMLVSAVCAVMPTTIE